MSSSFDRRSVLGLMAGAAAGGLATGAQAASLFRGVAVDVRPLEARGLGGPFAERVRAAVGQALAAEFAGSITPDRRAPVLVVSVRSVSLSAFGGPSGGRRGGGGGDTSTDFLDAVVSAGGSSFPLLVTQASQGGGDLRYQGNEAQRIEALGRATAYWTRRRLGG